MKATSILVGVLLSAAVAWFVLLPRSASNLLIEQAVARQMADGDVSIFLTINNQGIPDRLTSVDSNLGDVSLYNPAETGDLPIQIGRSSLAADSAYILLAPGETTDEAGALLAITLTFEIAGDIQVKARMSDSMNETHAAMAHMGDMEMSDMDHSLAAPTVEIAASADGGGWKIEITTEGFTFSEEQMGTPHQAGVGHAHIYAGGMKLGRIFGSEYEVGQLPAGAHEIRVTLNTNDHRAYMGPNGPVTAATVIIVD